MLLKSALENAQPLSGVGFVHDYVQLHFQDVVLTLYSRLAVESAGQVLRQGADPFADALTKLIGQRIASVGYDTGKSLSLRFSGGSVVVASLRAEDTSGPELFQLAGPDLPLLVEQVA